MYMSRSRRPNSSSRVSFRPYIHFRQMYGKWVNGSCHGEILPYRENNVQVLLWYRNKEQQLNESEELVIFKKKENKINIHPICPSNFQFVVVEITLRLKFIIVCRRTHSLCRAQNSYSSLHFNGTLRPSYCSKLSSRSEWTPSSLRSSRPRLRLATIFIPSSSTGLEVYFQLFTLVNYCGLLLSLHRLTNCRAVELQLDMLAC